MGSRGGRRAQRTPLKPPKTRQRWRRTGTAPRHYLWASTRREKPALKRECPRETGFPHIHLLPRAHLPPIHRQSFHFDTEDTGPIHRQSSSRIPRSNDAHNVGRPRSSTGGHARAACRPAAHRTQRRRPTTLGRRQRPRGRQRWMAFVGRRPGHHKRDIERLCHRTPRACLHVARCAHTRRAQQASPRRHGHERHAWHAATMFAQVDASTRACTLLQACGRSVRARRRGATRCPAAAIGA